MRRSIGNDNAGGRVELRTRCGGINCSGRSRSHCSGSTCHWRGENQPCRTPSSVGNAQTEGRAGAEVYRGNRGTTRRANPPEIVRELRSRCPLCFGDCHFGFGYCAFRVLVRDEARSVRVQLVQQKVKCGEQIRCGCDEASICRMIR
jgi:hypothetical protein